MAFPERVIHRPLRTRCKQPLRDYDINSAQL
jgi:hypothetical protein